MKFQKEWLELSDPLFELKIISWYKEMNGVKYLSSTRKEHVQTAIDEVYGLRELRHGHFGGPFPKFEILGRHHLQIFKSPAPTPSFSIKDKIATRKVLLAKQKLLQEKIALLDYWQTNMYSSDEGSFLQGDPESVQSALYMLRDDAKKKAGLSDSTEQLWMKLWYGAEASSSGSWTRSRTEIAISGEASFAVGAKLSGEMTWEFKGVKATIKHEEFLGIRGAIEGSASLSHRGIEAEASAFIKIGVEIKAEAEIDIYDTLSLGGSVEAFAGAMAEGSARFSIGKDGLSLAASGEAFAGVKLAAEGHFIAKWKGREIFKTAATASLNAGVGVNGQFELTVPRVGKSSFTLAAGVTLGVGTDVGTTIEFSMSNLRLSGVQWIYENAKQALTPEGERYQLMMGDRENTELCSAIKAELGDMLKLIEVQQKTLEVARTR